MIDGCRMLRSFLILAASTVLAFAGTLAQSSAPKTVLPPGRTTVPSTGGTHQPPCWQQVGISKSAIGQRRSIEQKTRAEVESVCADSSLTSEQKREKIREVHQQAHQQIEAIITPQQLEELKACGAERAASRPPLSHPHPTRGTGPCSDVLTGPAQDRPSAPENPAANADQSKQH